MPPCSRKVVHALAMVAMFTFPAIAADKYKIVNEGGIREDWAAADGAKFTAPGYPAVFAPRGDDVCLAMGYAIQADGTTDDFAIVKAWSSSRGEEEPVEGFWQAFEQAGATALSGWKFKPRVNNRSVPTYTVATLIFQGKGLVNMAELRGRCAVSDLKTAVQHAKSDRFMRGSDKHQMEVHAQQMKQAQMRAAAAASAGWSKGGN